VEEDDMKSRDSGLGIRDSGLGIRVWGFGQLLWLVLLLPFASLSYAGTQSTAGEQSNLQITVRVYNYAEVSRGTLTRAEEEASRIFREAGVETTWVDCPTSQAEADKYPACELPLGAMGVDLRILTRAMAARVQSGRERLGFALPSTKVGSASAAWVFYHRVEQLAESKDASAAQILGHAVAHEIGHLLLGPNRHSPTGVMRAEWGRAELQRASRGEMLFTPEQCGIIRAEVQARMTMQQAAVESASVK
jgi:hypothetical protein